jgi:hypothetical protein
LSKLETEEEKLPIFDKIRYIPYPIVLIQIFDKLPVGGRKKQQILDKIKEYSLIIGEDHRESFTEASTRTLDLFQTSDNFLPDISLLENPYALAATADSPHVLQFLLATRHF